MFHAERVPGRVMRAAAVAVALAAGVVALQAPSVTALPSGPPSVHAAEDADDAELRIPDDFMLGAGSSSYQIEGAWDVDGEWTRFASRAPSRSGSV